MPWTTMRRAGHAAVKATAVVGAVLLLGAALATPSLADPGEHGRGHAWGHHKRHHHDDGPVVIYGASPPPVVVVPAPPPPPRVVYAPSYAPPAVVYAPPPQPGVSVQMNIPLR
ncbi:hypothetical protein [Azospirillum sp. B506]|uniref:hypothetical protein n=1 Tax=Azospirillum sp. B506 TaxID=137721 RepID=UPI0009FD78D9|nr:hypothetical protein [Azospirillum sp. B506]